MLTEFALPILKSATTELLEQVKRSQRAKGIRDRGESANSLHVTGTSQGSEVATQLRGLKRWDYQQNGRGPNRSGKPSRAMILAMAGWAVRHGMKASAGYPIAAKIAREGIKVPNAHNPGGVLSEPLSAKNVRSLFSNRLKVAFEKELKSNLFAV